jgi:hypothetical protein
MTSSIANDNLEQYNSASLAGGEYKVYGIVYCRNNSQHYDVPTFPSSRAERVVCDKQHISMKVSNNCDANRVEYAYFSAPCGSHMHMIWKIQPPHAGSI